MKRHSHDGGRTYHEHSPEVDGLLPHNCCEKDPDMHQEFDVRG